MRRVTIELLRCPSCRRGPLRPSADTTEVLFGPLQCHECASTFPVDEGIVDFALERVESRSRSLQRGLERPLVARAYERYLRPTMQLLLARHRFDRDSEYLLYRSLLGQPEAPVLDLGCGTALFARRLAREPDMPPVIGLDLSRPMIEEGILQCREAGVMIDFLRAEMPYLPFADDSLGAILQTGALHMVEDLPLLLREVRRTLRPGGTYVASSFLPPGKAVRRAYERAGIHPRDESTLRRAVEASGLERFERVVLPPYVVFKARRA